MDPTNLERYRAPAEPVGFARILRSPILDYEYSRFIVSIDARDPSYRYTAAKQINSFQRKWNPIRYLIRPVCCFTFSLKLCSYDQEKLVETEREKTGSRWRSHPSDDDLADFAQLDSANAVV